MPSRPAGRPHRSLAYSPALDGIRALSVIGVMLYHGLVPWLPGGFLGVDVFFVLSGYLITSLLLVEWRRWRDIDLLTFWTRRARRLLPALLVVVTATCVVSWWLEPPEKLATIRGDAMASLFYVANWRFVIKDLSYFDQYGDPSPFRHMWSLGIEEQYYLLFPLLLLGLLALRRPRVLAPVLLVGAVASAVLMAVLFDPLADPSRVYFGTDTRAQELLVGACAAALVQHPPDWIARSHSPRWLWELFGALSLAAVVTTFIVARDSDPWLYQGGFFAVSCAAALLIVTASRRHTLVTRLLSMRPVVAVGVISYGLYLWHWPIDVFVSPFRTSLEGPELLAVRLAAALGCALASYFLLERPIRRGGLSRLTVLPRRLLVWTPVPLVTALVLATTASAVAPPGERWQLPPASTGQSNKPHIAVIGDSVAATVAEGVPTDVGQDYRVTDEATLGCGLGPKKLFVAGRDSPEFAHCDDSASNVAAALETDPPDATIMFYGAWETVDHVVDGRRLHVGTPAYARYLSDQYRTAIKAASPGGAPLLLANVPCYHDTSTVGALAAIADNRNSVERQAAVNAIIGSVAQDMPNVTVIDLRSFLCSGPKAGEDPAIRYDGVHFTAKGAANLWRWMLPQLESRLVDDGDTATAEGVRTMLLGDSVPNRLIADGPADPGVIRPLDGTKLGCGLIPEPAYVEDKLVSEQGPDCAAFVQELGSRIDNLKPDVGLVFLGIGEQFDRKVGDKVLEFGTDAYASWLGEALAERTGLFTSRGLPVILVNIPCHRVADIGLAPQTAAINDDERIQWVNGFADAFVRNHPDVKLADLNKFLCADGYQEELNGVHLRTDGMHFTPDGAALVWDWLADQPTVRRLGR
ncbi:MAG: acyltransferase family protein [Nocardioidaceae bacterium]